MVKLLVTNDYRSSLGEYRQGQVLELDDDRAALLLRDSPGSFLVYSETETGLDVPDRRMHGGRRR